MRSAIAIDRASHALRRGREAAGARSARPIPSGLAALDEALPTQGWPEAALTELLIPADGIGELELLWPALARMSTGDRVVVLVAPPYLPYAPAWVDAGVRLGGLQVVDAEPRNALWAAEQCLRSGACAAVVCWPHRPDDRALRRLQMAAETGQACGFALRPLGASINPSPAALRIAIEPGSPRQLRIVKCRGRFVPPRPVPFPASPVWHR